MDYKLQDFISYAIDEYFTAESPMIVESDRISDLADKIRLILSEFEHIELDKLSRQKDRRWPSQWPSRRHVLDFSVKLPPDYTLLRMDETDFTVDLDRENQLQLHFYTKTAKVSSLLEFVTLGLACQSYAEQSHEEANQLQEIRDSKTRGILAHLKKLAHEKGYVFGKLGANFSEDMNVYIQVGEKDKFSLKLVYQYYPEILELIDPAICTMTQLYEMGIKFHIERCPPDNWFHGEWITPESLDREEKRVDL